MIGYSLALLIGLSLGLLGGGGSILTVPVLVYVMNLDPKLSIALSLAIVGVTSLFGVIGHAKQKNVDFKMAAIFGGFAMLGTFSGAKLSVFLTGQAQLILFAVIMILASYFMIKKPKLKDSKSEPKIIAIALQAIVVGIITGLVGVGGGFMIVPALVLLAGISMKRAVGTSLVIISANSFTGFLGYLNMFDIPWEFLLKFTSFSVLGIFLGSFLVKYISQDKLKKSFGIFLIFMGIFVLYKNLGA